MTAEPLDDGDGTPVVTDFWDVLRMTTQSRIGLGRAGDSLPTRRVLEFSTAHALARDAVHEPLDAVRFAETISGMGIGDPVIVTSQAATRGEYLRRPDLGRVPNDLSGIETGDYDIGFVLADGLSPRALVDHGAGLLQTLVTQFRGRYSMATPVIATQARVALGDHIAQAMGAHTLIVLIGERPGLSVADSLGIYLTHLPRPGRADSDRNCISNIHPPDGLSYQQAAIVTAGLVEGARTLGQSGVKLKDTSRTAVGPSGATSVLDTGR